MCCNVYRLLIIPYILVRMFQIFPDHQFYLQKGMHFWKIMVMSLPFDSAGHYNFPFWSEAYPASALPCGHLQCGLPERGLPPDTGASRAAASAHLTRWGWRSSHWGSFREIWAAGAGQWSDQRDTRLENHSASVQPRSCVSGQVRDSHSLE